VIEPLHPVFATPNILGIFIVNKLGLTNFTEECSACKVDEFVRFKGGVRLAALRAQVALVIEFLYLMRATSGIFGSQHTFLSVESIM
jgi:hypothetical protein